MPYKPTEHPWAWTRYCDDCGEMLAFGAANDEPVTVRAEIVAAKIAIGDFSSTIGATHPSFRTGWFDDEACGEPSSLWWYEVGVLARAIHEHDEEAT